MRMIGPSKHVRGLFPGWAAFCALDCVTGCGAPGESAISVTPGFAGYPVRANLARPRVLLRPCPASADASATRRKTLVVTHDELRLDLLHCIHRDANHDQQ